MLFGHIVGSSGMVSVIKNKLVAFCNLTMHYLTACLWSGMDLN